MKNSRENEFWARIAATANPGWTMDVQEDPTLGRPTLANAKVFVYLFDTHKPWTSAGGITEAEARESVRKFKAADAALRAQIQDAAGAAIVQAADAGATPTDEVTRDAVSMALFALSETKTYEIATSKTGSISGHWIMIVYRMKNGDTLTRPVFLKSDAPGLLPPEELIDIVRTVAGQDLKNANGIVGDAAARSGGVDFAAGFL